MLIAEDDIKNKPADELQAQAQAQAQSAQPAAPPSYQASVQPQPPQPAAQPLASSSQQQPILPLHNPPHQSRSYGSTASSSAQDQRKARKQAKKKALRRFIKAALAAIGIWLLVSIVIETFVQMVKHTSSSPLPDYDNHGENLPAILPVPPGVRRKRCLKVHDFVKTAGLNELQTSFDVPLDDYDSLVLLSHGYLSKGITTIQQSTVDNGSKDARVDVKMVYDENHKELLDDLQICSIERGSGGGRRGVGVFSPTRWPHRNLPSMALFPTFFITLHLPTSQTFIKKLETDLANHQQLFLIPPPTPDHTLRFGSLDMRSTNGAVRGEGVRFLDGSIVTSNSPINIKNVECNQCTVHSTNGDIGGTYHARNMLVLETTNAAVDVNVFLGYDDMEGGPASATLKTTNGNLKGNVSLIGKTSDSRPSSYIVTSSTTNAKSELLIPSMPSKSTLISTSTTTNGQSLVTLPNEFEGKIHLLTTNAKAVLGTLGREDPEGRGRKERFDFSKMSGSQVQGERNWGEGHGKGNVVATTSNEQIKLVV